MRTESVARPYTYTDGITFNSSTAPRRRRDPDRHQRRPARRPGRAPPDPSRCSTLSTRASRPSSASNPSANFPALIIDWGAQTDGTFFDSGRSQRIALLADLTADTDEFDQHVVAHEFGHYIEHNFSRADNIGGAHGIGDKLDPRVAFGEGFGYAFAAIVLNDPVARDSFVRRHDAERRVASMSRPIHRPAARHPERQFRLLVQRVVGVVDPLGPLRHPADDGNDTVALGFAPLWDVLTGPAANNARIHDHLRFLTALKTTNRRRGARRSTRSSPRRTSTRPTSTRSRPLRLTCPSSVPTAVVLPIYATVTVGGAAVVGRTRRRRRHVTTSSAIIASSASRSDHAARSRSVASLLEPGHQFRPGFPRAPRRRAGTRSASIRLTQLRDGRDVHRRRPETTSSTSTIAPTAAMPSEGTPGDYNLTVTIN